VERTFKNLKEKGRLNGGIEGDALAFIVVEYKWKRKFSWSGNNARFCLFMQCFS